MSTRTALLRLTKPDFDQNPWDADANGNMDILDATIGKYLAIANFQGLWTNSTSYIVNDVVVEIGTALMYQCAVSHTSAASPTTFSADRAAHSTYWTIVSNANSMAAASATAAAQNALSALNVANNAIINGAMGFFDYGTPNTNTGYVANRWSQASDMAGATVTTTQKTTTTASLLNVGVKNYLEYVITGSPTGGTFHQFYQNIEDARTFSNRQVTLSFWAWGTSVSSFSSFLSQDFGTGGSPSSAVLTATANHTITSTPTRFSATWTLPSVSGKTFGSNNNSSLRLLFVLPVNANMTLNITGIKLEAGPSASDFYPRPSALERMMCDRFYQTGLIHVAGYTSGAGINVSYRHALNPMRIAPSVNATFTLQTNCTGSVGAPSVDSFNVNAASSGVGQVVAEGSYTANAEL